jgi:uncharacterized protein
VDGGHVADPPAPPPPPGWFGDPARRAELRWWDGARWTSWVSVQGVVTDEAAASSTLPGGGAAGTGATRHRPAGLPFGAAWLALGAVVGGAFAAGVVGTVAHLLAPGTPAVGIGVGAAALYAAMLAACVYASRRHGTGRMDADLGLRFRPADAGWGLLAWFGASLAAVAVTAALAPFPELQGTNTDLLREESDAATLAVTVVVAVGLAPLFEELVFRGLLLRALLARLAAPVAVLAQAVPFGLVHFLPGEGVGNVGLVLALTGVGAVLGAAAVRTGRLGPSIVGHGLFNAVATVAALATP